ncbi:hypothetical protein BDR03DRAFT_512362 [Suillus americanus]|nr:hypothetical protein BDR03DRAFT_512362 [Suillus americanus]
MHQDARNSKHPWIDVSNCLFISILHSFVHALSILHNLLIFTFPLSLLTLLMYNNLSL